MCALPKYFITSFSIYLLRLAIPADAADVPQIPHEANKSLLLSSTWEARVWGPYGKGYYPSVKCEEKGMDIFCSYSGGSFSQDIKYEVLQNGDLKTLTTRGVPVTLVRKGDGFESLAKEAGIQLTPKK